ncbi:hypothetical protein K443DRAFT_677425 [Laccaria amethystina LaAM-08-1]|uniref:Uncharacterized protein n=1 Tax=Laccaria amethystina LaAM-08-1 TaxID=1095629 RepID=A0A0C9Y3L2_9AGAR|nr:hypothetical protein K443DRAFT_677425 [Laccaria amethystina LaAM-08-1]
MSVPDGEFSYKATSRNPAQKELLDMYNDSQLSSCTQPRFSARVCKQVRDRRGWPVTSAGFKKPPYDTVRRNRG